MMSDQQSNSDAATTAADANMDADLLTVSNQDFDGIAGVVAEGDIDLSTAPLLKSALESVCKGRQEAGIVALDLRSVPFIDSAGLALLVEIRKRYFETCQLALVIEKGSQPERVLRLGRFDTFLKVRYSPDELRENNTVAAAA